MYGQLQRHAAVTPSIVGVWRLGRRLLGAAKFCCLERKKLLFKFASSSCAFNSRIGRLLSDTGPVCAVPSEYSVGARWSGGECDSAIRARRPGRACLKFVT